MKLSNKKILLIILLITIALSGLVILQTILLNTALKAEEETFRSKVILALNNVVKDLTNFEARNAILKISIDDSTVGGTERVLRITENNNGNINDTTYYYKEISNRSPLPKDSLTKFFEYSIEHNSVCDSNITIDSNFNKIEVAMFIDDSLIRNTNHKNFKYISDPFEFKNKTYNNDSTRIFLIEAALSQLEQMEHIPIEERIDTLTLDSSINVYFKQINVDLEYSFAVTNMKSDSIILNSRINNLETISNSPYRTLLFPHDILEPSNYLVVNFPNKGFYIYSKLLSLILPTMFFLLIIISCFIYSIKLILDQRKTSILLTDFINNMTHEFKTPISTIQLASEAISKEEVLSDKDKMRKFNNMILSENKRMKNQVDKILQIATLEEGDYILKQEKLDMHKLIHGVVETFSILLKQYKGNIILNLNAELFEIDGDKVHIQNIIYNLIENGLKYSKDNPQITITTVNNNSCFELSIKDKGIGIHPDDIKLVFKKYYRVSTGDVHNIKGFGLGLSYVKMIVEAHDGSVKLLSALDKGTEVITSFPLR